MATGSGDSNKIISFSVTVRNLHEQTNGSTLFSYFKDFGPINGKVTIRKFPNGKSKGFVNYKNLEDAEKACEKMDGKVIDGCVISASCDANKTPIVNFEKLTDCTYFQEGNCTKGPTCPYRHYIHGKSVQECVSWKSGSCKNENCIYAHPSKKYSKVKPSASSSNASFNPPQVRHRGPPPQQHPFSANASFNPPQVRHRGLPPQQHPISANASFNQPQVRHRGPPPQQHPFSANASFNPPQVRHRGPPPQQHPFSANASFNQPQVRHRGPPPQQHPFSANASFNPPQVRHRGPPPQQHPFSANASFNPPQVRHRGPPPQQHPFSANASFNPPQVRHRGPPPQQHPFSANASFNPPQVRHRVPPPQKLQVDSPVDVIVEGETHHAVVKWIGVISQFGNTIMAGIELAQPIEDGNDGVFHGKRYFTCADKCGYFVQAKQCTLSLRKLSINSIDQSTGSFICGHYLKNLCANAENCHYYHPAYQTTFCWFYKFEAEKDDAFKLFPKELNLEIEKAFSDPKIEDYTCTDPSVQMAFGENRIKFDGKYEGKAAIFRRWSTKSSAISKNEPHFTVWNWYWKDEYGYWQYYQTNTTIDESIEVKYQEHCSSSNKSKVSFSANQFNYELDFESFFQKNLSTGTKREMRSRPKFVESSTKKSEEEIFPLHWPSDDNSVKLIPVPNDVRSKIERKFAETMIGSTNYVIQSVEEVVNKELYKQYYTKKGSLTEKLKKVNEMQLWHGTSYDIVGHIVHGNFDWRLCSESVLYGKGSYFARDASYSKDYTRVDGSGVETMFLADVLVGEYCQGASGMQRPTTKPGEKFVSYDSCVDNVSQPSIYIIFDFTQVYPRYIIKYKRT